MTATEAPPDLAAILAADPTFLDQLADRMKARPDRFFNMRGEPIATAATTGRVQVSPGQTISSASWGNPVWDQSINCFASAADRDTQWPSPHDGSICFHLDTATYWVRRAGVWHGLPMGYVASSTGPATTVVCATTGTVFLTLAAPVVAGRRYLVSGQVLGTVATAGAGGRCDLTGADVVSRPIMVGGASLLASGVQSGSFASKYTASTTGTATFTLTGFTVGGSFSVGVNNAEIVVTDIGG